MFDSLWVELYLTGSWWNLSVRLCLYAFIIFNQELFSTAYTVHTMNHVNWMYMRRLIGHFYANIYFSWKFVFACVCHMVPYCVVQLRGLCLPSNTGLYDRARPGAGSRPSLPWRVLHGGSGLSPPSA